MTITELIILARNIVISWPYSEDRVDTFSTFKSRSELNETTYGRSYEDYLNGSFWARNWVKAGASRNDMAKNGNAILFENKRRKVVDLTCGKNLANIYITSLQYKERPDGSKKTEDEMAENNANVLMDFLAEFQTYGKYDYQISGSDPDTAWITELHARHLEDQDNVDFVTFRGMDLCSRIVNLKNIELFETNWGFQGFQGSSMMLQVEVNNEPAREFDYRFEEYDTKNIIVC